MPGRVPSAPEETPKFVDPAHPETKKPPPRPENPNAPKTLRDLLRLPER
jgi:hypothetical protein